MASNFTIKSSMNVDTIYLKLFGIFDDTSACELILHLIETESCCRVEIHNIQ